MTFCYILYLFESLVSFIYCQSGFFMGMAVLLGVDMFDSASYVKYARDDRLLYTEGTRYLADVTELNNADSSQRRSCKNR